MSDIIHDPRTDWCACDPGGMDRCDYRMLADAVIGELNPRDGDEAEVALCIAAVERAAEFIRSQTCACQPGDETGPCDRCAALGQWHGKSWS